MDVFKKVAAVRNGGVVETLHWDGRQGYMLEASFAAMGQITEVEKTPEEARRDLATWGQLDRLEDDFEVLYADAEALDRIMEGQEWHELRADDRTGETR